MTCPIFLRRQDRRSRRGLPTPTRAIAPASSRSLCRPSIPSQASSPLSIALGRNAGFQTTLVGKCKDAQVPLAIAGAPNLVRTIFGAQSFAVSAKVHVAGSTTKLTDVRIIGDSIEAIGRYDAHGATDDGVALIQTSLANVGVILHDGEASLTPFASHAWYDRMLLTKPRAHAKMR